MNRVAKVVALTICCCVLASAQVPTITSFTPQSGGVPTRVKIYGSNFSPTPANNVVRFGTALGTPSVTFADSIFVTAPGNATFGPVTVTVGGRTAYASKVFYTTFGGGGFTASSFVTPTPIGVSSNSQTIKLADLDGDGKLDIILPQNAGSSVRVARNTSSVPGEILFGTAQDIPTSWLGPRSVAVADIDGDGKLDIVAACEGAASPGRLSVLRSTSTSGTIAFAAAVNFRDTTDFLYIPYGVTVADFDGDGRPDIATAGQLSSGSWFHVFRNVSSTGSITTSSFEHPVKYAAGSNALRIGSADFDGDGKVDIVVITSSGQSVLANVHRNTTTGSVLSFASPITLNLPSGAAAELAIGDLNNDGKPEIISSSKPVGIGSLTIFPNVSTIGDLTFSQPVTIPLSGSSFQVEVADIDGDAKPDILVMGNPQINIYRNVNTGGALTEQSFAPRVDILGLSSSVTLSLVVGDLDGDTKPEITVGTYWSQQNPVVTIKNRISAGFIPTPISTGTTADLEDVSFATRDLGTIAGRGGVVRMTTNGGTTWTGSPTGTTDDIFGIRIIGSRGFIVGSGGLICVSTNFGTSWTPFTTGTTQTFYGASFTGESAGWAVGSGGTICIYNGTNWTPQPTGTTVDFRAVYAIGSTGFAVGSGGTICRYNGSSWVPQVSGTTTVTFNDVAFVNDQIGYVVGTDGTICKTTNGGTTWVPLDAGLAGINLRSVRLANANVVWAVGDGGLVAQTADGGTTWTVSGLGVSDDLLGIDFVQGQGVIVGKAGKGFKFTTTLVDVREANPPGQFPAAFVLEQNYPNPFNPTTIIKFSLPEAGHVTLRVYDVLGREVKSLVSEFMSSGHYETTFVATGLASGVYFYRLTSGGFSLTRRLVLLR